MPNHACRHQSSESSHEFTFIIGLDSDIIVSISSAFYQIIKTFSKIKRVNFIPLLRLIPKSNPLRFYADLCTIWSIEKGMKMEKHWGRTGRNAKTHHCDRSRRILLSAVTLAHAHTLYRRASKLHHRCLVAEKKLFHPNKTWNYKLTWTNLNSESIGYGHLKLKRKPARFMGLDRRSWARRRLIHFFTVQEIECECYSICSKCLRTGVCPSCC